MKFLMGIFIGVTLSVGAMSLPAPREKMLDAVLSWMEKVKTMQMKGDENIEPLSTEKSPGDTVAVKNKVPHSPSLPEPSLHVPSLHVPSLHVPSLAEPSLSKPSLSEPSLSDSLLPDLSLPVTSLPNTPPSISNDSIADRRQIEFNHESLEPAARLFQVAWSPFRSQTSAKGFAAKLEKQLGQDFRVIRTGPGRYEVGFHFDTKASRLVVLSAISDLTGFKTKAPPRMLH